VFLLLYLALIASIDGAMAPVFADCFRRLGEVKVLAAVTEGIFLRQKRHRHGEMELESNAIPLG